MLERVGPVRSGVLHLEREDNGTSLLGGKIPNGPTEATAKRTAGVDSPSAGNQVEDIAHGRLEKPKLSFGRGNGEIRRIVKLEGDSKNLPGRKLGRADTDRTGIRRSSKSRGG
jgi:hypothetical protein